MPDPQDRYDINDPDLEKFVQEHQWASEEELNKFLDAVVERRQAGPPSLRDASKAFFDAHPTTKAIAKGLTNTLPFVGMTIPAAAAVANPEMAPVAGRAVALGGGLGEGLKDLINEGTGLSDVTTPTSKAIRMGRTAGEIALGNKGMDLLVDPSAATRPIANFVGQGLRKGLKMPATASMLYGLWRGDPVPVIAGAAAPMLDAPIREAGERLVQYAGEPIDNLFMARGKALLDNAAPAERPAILDALENAAKRSQSTVQQQFVEDARAKVKLEAANAKAPEASPYTPEEQALLARATEVRPPQAGARTMSGARVTPSQAIRFSASQTPAEAVASPTPPGALRISDAKMPAQADMPAPEKVSLPANKEGKFSDNDVAELGQLLGLKRPEEYAMLRKVLDQDGLNGVRPDIAAQFTALRAGRHMNYYEGAKNAAKVRQMGEPEPDVKF